MNKSIILSVSQEEALNILNGKQTALLRKRIPKDYKGWVYGYVGKGKPYLYTFANLDYGISDEIINQQYHISLNQTIPFRFWFDQYEIIKVTESRFDGRLWSACYEDKERLYDYYLKLNLTESDFHHYSKGSDLYALNINNLETFDKPMQLNDFIVDFVDCDTDICGKEVDWYKLPIPLQKPPKTYQYVWVK